MQKTSQLYLDKKEQFYQIKMENNRKRTAGAVLTKRVIPLAAWHAMVVAR